MVLQNIFLKDLFNPLNTEVIIMRERKFRCKNCGKIFIVQVFEEGEAEEKGLPSSPVRCPRCKSSEVERRS